MTFSVNVKDFSTHKFNEINKRVCAPNQVFISFKYNFNIKKRIQEKAVFISNFREETMGVRGLKSFLERENQIYEIKIGDEIQKWKRY